MAITIQMIETKEFKTKARGYDPEEVDLFLDEIVDEFEAMQAELKKLRAAATSPRQAPAPQPVQRVSQDEESVRTMLVSAQRICDETIAGAKGRADELMHQANDQAETIVRDARTEASNLRMDMETLKSAVSDYRARFKRLVEDQMHIINAETELFRQE